MTNNYNDQNKDLSDHQGSDNSQQSLKSYMTNNYPNQSHGNNDKDTQQNNDQNDLYIDEPEVVSELSKVANSPIKNIIILLIFVGGIGGFIYMSFFSEKPKNDHYALDHDIKLPQKILKPSIDDILEKDMVKQDIPIPEIKAPVIDVPPPPQITKVNEQKPKNDVQNTKKDDKKPEEQDALLPPPLPVSKPGIDTSSDSNLAKKIIDYSVPNNTESTRKQIIRKRKSKIMLISNNASNRNSGSDSNDINDWKKSAIKVELKYKGDPHHILSKGKIIHAVTASAAHSDMGGEIVAIVSRNVYSQKGKNVLIPKGSKIFGTFNSGYQQPYGRFNIAWYRVDLPSGFVLNISGNSVDQLGRSGTESRADNKQKEKLINSVMVSVFNIAVAKGLDHLASVKKVTDSVDNTDIYNNIRTQVLNYASQGQDPSALCASLKSSIPSMNSLYAVVSNICTPEPSSSLDWSDITNKLLALSVSQGGNYLDKSDALLSQSKEDQAYMSAYRDVSKEVKNMVSRGELAPTATIDQGQPITIYITEDFLIPPQATKHVRFIH